MNQTPKHKPASGAYPGYGTAPVKKNARYSRESARTGVLLCAILFMLVICICLFFIARSGGRANSPTEDTRDWSDSTYPYETIASISSDDTVVTEALSLSFVGPPIALTEPVSEAIPVANSEIGRGTMILVNGEHPYTFPEGEKQTAFYGNKSSGYMLHTISLSLDSDLFPIFDQMIVDFSKATGCRELLVTSGYRSFSDQEKILSDRIASQGEEQAALYVAKPGHSEHHSGLAIDMVIFTDGRQYYFPEHEAGAWIIENAPKYGFILRYTEKMQELTGCAAEPWHYRYIGVPHAQLVTALDLCYEQYIDYLHTFTWAGERLFIAPDGTTSTGDGFTLPESGYMVYSVPANSDGDTTDIPLPPGCTDYEISGDNIGGFIVTVHFS